MRASWARSTGKADKTTNHRIASGVAEISRVQRGRPGSQQQGETAQDRVGLELPSSATTTSLNEKPKLRSMNTSPESTCQAANEAMAFGMRLSAALPSAARAATSARSARADVEVQQRPPVRSPVFGSSFT